MSAHNSGVAAGWKLVPVQPTPEMLDAYKEFHRKGQGHMDISVYSAMFAAAPVAQAVPVAGEWVSVDERLPAPHVVVVLRNENTQMNVPFDAEIDWTGTGYLANCGNDYWSVFGERGGVTMESVTHWMPLPPAPVSAK